MPLLEKAVLNSNVYNKIKNKSKLMMGMTSNIKT